MFGSYFRAYAEASMRPNADKKCSNCKKYCPYDNLCSRKCLGEYVSKFKWITVFEDGTTLKGMHQRNPYLEDPQGLRA